jgi:cytochrome c553
MIVGQVHAAEAAVSSQELQAKINYCKTCHGVSGQGYRGAFPMPRLVGQQPEYLENQLRAFIERRRTNPVMFNVAHVLNPSMLMGLAAHFKDLNPKPLGEHRENSLRQEGTSTMKEHLAPIYLRALPATAQAPKEMVHFLAWQGSFTIMS